MYKPNMTIKETQKAIKLIKVFFERELTDRLNLTRVSAPLFVPASSGLNDTLNGVERPVAFDALNMPELGHIEIVHSLAKWKRKALKDYGFSFGEGIYTNMNAIRRDEVPDEIHSIYVDQWDFEKVISPYERSLDYLKSQVDIIYTIFRDCEIMLHERYPFLEPILPDTITYMTTEELRQRYPQMSPKQREREAVLEHHALFLIGIGRALGDGELHDGRAPDYDDWDLNGDLLFYNPVLDDVMELSSMGIRVDGEALLKQLKIRGEENKTSLPFHAALIKGELPLTYGGGIGQSRICQILLRRYHIGEVQCSLWPEEMIESLRREGIHLL